MYWMFVGAFFLVPIYYRAKAKGFNGVVWAVAALCLGVGSLLASIVIPWPILSVLGFGFPAAVLLGMFILPARPGAPGSAYLKITFQCPECDQTIWFPRHAEGTAELCPECGEIVTVPKDDHSPRPSPKAVRKPQEAEGPVLLESFGRPLPARLLAAVLNDNGINAFVSGDDAGGALPHVGNTQGYRVMIDATDWDDAMKFREQCQQEDGQLSSGTAAHPGHWDRREAR